MNPSTLIQRRDQGTLTKADFTLRALRRRIEHHVEPYIKLLLPTYLPFPKDPSRWLSRYQYIPPKPGEWLSPHLLQDPFLLTGKLLDFSFLRSLLADTYGKTGGPCYDPPSLFLLETAAHLEGFEHTADFMKVLHHPQKGPYYWNPTGLQPPHIPCQMTLTHFRKRVNQQSAKNPSLKKYEEILQTLGWIFQQVGLISLRILATDGCLFPSKAIYRGCAHHQGTACQHLCVEGLLTRIRQSVAAVLTQYPHIQLGKTYRLYTDCPHPDYPTTDAHGNPLKRPRFQIFSYRFLPASDQPPDLNDPTLGLLGITEKLLEYGLCFDYDPLLLDYIAFTDQGKDLLHFACPKLPKDLDARLGVQRDNHNPHKKKFVFGYDKVTTYSVEPELETAFPVWTSTLAGNAHEGKEHRKHLEALNNIPHLNLPGGVHLNDSKADELHNYKTDRTQGYIPFIALNDRNDDLAKQGLQRRGYDKWGHPFAHCGLAATHFQGYDPKRGRLAFACGKACPNLQQRLTCPHQANRLGHVLHLYLRDNPRVFCELPRASPRYKKIYGLRNLAENGNSTEKVTLHHLQHPPVFGLSQANEYAFFSFLGVFFTKIANCIRTCSEAFRETKKPPSSRAPPWVKRRGRPPKEGTRRKDDPLSLRPLPPALRAVLS